MQLRYNKHSKFNYYDMKCSDVAFYRCWRECLLVGIKKNKLFGLFFEAGGSFNVQNYPCGFRIYYSL